MKAKVGNLFYKVKADENNELTVIELTGDVNFDCVVYRQCSVNIPDDCYSLKCNTENVLSQIELSTDYELRKESCNETLVFEFESVYIKQVLDLSLCFSDANTIEMGAFVYDANGELQYITDRKRLIPLREVRFRLI